MQPQVQGQDEILVVVSIFDFGLQFPNVVTNHALVLSLSRFVPLSLYCPICVPIFRVTFLSDF